MALHFYKLAVKNITAETPDAVSITFDVPENLKSHFTFKQGQNITLKKNINGQELRRTYSICSSPLDNELKIGIKKAFRGLFSTYACTGLKVGEVLEVMPPTGTFYTKLHPKNKKHYAAFAAGSGITPILSIIKTTLLIEPQSTFTLVYGNKNHLSMMFKGAIESLKDKYLHRFSLHHILSQEKTDTDINYGRIDSQKCIDLKRVINIRVIDEFFICGPHDMIFCVKEFLEKERVVKEKIHFELFTPPIKMATVLNKQAQVTEVDNISRVTIKLDGRSFDFTLGYDSNTILEAALAEGADLPYACKGGVCTTCKAKLVEGKIDMEVNYGLEPGEVMAGFILTCQSHPKSNRIVVDYDVH